MVSNRCRGCLSNADCVDVPSSPRCDPDLKFCTGCEEDADCADPANPVCEHSHCTVCRSDDDCKDPALPACSAGYTSSTCVECFTSDHCPDGMACVDGACEAE